LADEKSNLGSPANPIVLYYPRDLSGKDYPDHSFDEPCTDAFAVITKP